MAMTDNRAEELLITFITGDNLRHHCRMVAHAMKTYARELEKSEQEVHDWWLAGMLHDLDWEKFPDDHPNKALYEILPPENLPEHVMEAIRAHAPGRTGKHPETEIERYLFACDELSGFMHAVSLMRPNGFSDMKAKSVTKKLKDKKFAANVSREEIKEGAEMINKDLSEHITFLINAFSEF